MIEKWLTHRQELKTYKDEITAMGFRVDEELAKEMLKIKKNKEAPVKKKRNIVKTPTKKIRDNAKKEKVINTPMSYYRVVQETSFGKNDELEIISSISPSTVIRGVPILHFKGSRYIKVQDVMRVSKMPKAERDRYLK